MQSQKRNHTPNEALARIRHWCDRQERSQQDVRDKLYSWGLHHDDVEGLIAELIIGNYLNEERFARAYVSGKFRIKRWGRRKILDGLRAKRISDYCVRKGMEEIDEEDYLQTLNVLTEKKAALLASKSGAELRAKLLSYLAQKGYEQQLVWDAVDIFLNAKNGPGR